MRDFYFAIKNLMRTEKGTQIAPLNKYIFNVDVKATKVQIKRAVEKIYKVKVESVNTIKMHGKLRRVRYKAGYTPDWKKAVVTLKPPSKIEITT
jgi:large subunit ribosomal protein L23